MANSRPKKTKDSETSSVSSARAAKRRRTNPESSGVEDNSMDIDADDTDVELLTTPTPVSKSSKSLTLLEKAQHFKLAFKDDATNDEILGTFCSFYNYI